MKQATPYALIFKFYWFRLFCVALIWFMYNVSLKRLCSQAWIDEI